MDDAKADALTKRLLGTTIDGWMIRAYIDRGKSAAVFKAEKDAKFSALKVFDSELIEKYGDEKQLRRIEREVSLKGSKHENVVEIYGGGYSKENDIYYVNMEFVDGPNLKKALFHLSEENRWALIPQLARAAKWLEDKGLAHRDIKPENIAVIDNGNRLVLLDLGVIRPVKGSDLTDAEGINAFIGTLQYSSPEFLLRTEIKNKEGYRAITFYQIGAVLHDLIMNRPIFQQFEQPYAKLVMAVQFERPVIVNPDAPDHLVGLAIRCLAKDPELRLKIVEWDHFFVDPLNAKRASAKSRVVQKIEISKSEPDTTNSSDPKLSIDHAGLTQILNTLKAAARHARSAVPGLPPIAQEKLSEGVGTCFLMQSSVKIGLQNSLRIYIMLEIIDGAQGIIKAFGSAALGCKLTVDMIRSEGEVWYLDTYETILIQKYFDDFYFRCLDWSLYNTDVSSTFPGGAK